MVFCLVCSFSVGSFQDKDIVLDTEEIYFEIGRTIIARYGKTFEWSLKSRLMGMPWNEAVDLLLETLDLPITRDEYIAEAKSLEHLFVKASLLPGVERLVSHLSTSHIPMAVRLFALRMAWRTFVSLCCA
jgi:pseudouridine 5'-phosphatase